MPNCSNYNTLHPGFRNRLDRAIKNSLVGRGKTEFILVEDSDNSDYLFKVTIVKLTSGEKSRIIGYAKMVGADYEVKVYQKTTLSKKRETNLFKSYLYI